MGISVIGGATGGGGKFQKTEIITSTQSWTVPADVDQIEVWAFGGGGGGGGWSTETGSVGLGGGGGGGGGCDYKVLSVTPSASYTVAVGAGGAGQGAMTGGVTPPAGHGSASSFGATMAIGYGGQGGSAGNGNSQAPGLFSRTWQTATGYTQNYIGSSGGGGSTASVNSDWVVGGGGGGAGAAAPINGQHFTQNSYTSLSIGGFGQGNAGSHGTSVSVSSFAGSNIVGNGGRGLLGFGGGGGGGAAAHDFSGTSATWNALYSNVRYRMRGIDGGGDGAWDIYNNAVGNAPAGEAQRLATNGAAGKAGGGGGGCRTNWWTSAGGNGGSGVVVIKYWTAG